MTSQTLPDGSALIEKILDIVAAEAAIERSKLTPDALLEHLQIQSADYVMILMAIETEFGVYITVDSEISDARTVGDLIEIFVAKVTGSSDKVSA